jgi:hypothetical protein
MATIPAVPTLTVCCVCKHVAQGGSGSWTPMATFLEQHHLRPIDVRVSHTYCPVCYEEQAEAWSISKRRVQHTTPRAA